MRSDIINEMDFIFEVKYISEKGTETLIMFPYLVNKDGDRWRSLEIWRCLRKMKNVCAKKAGKKFGDLKVCLFFFTFRFLY